VAERALVKDGDARRLPFADGAFDVIVTHEALHNIGNAAERDTAVREIARVLRPGGRLFLGDVRHTGRYLQVLRECGLEDLRRRGGGPLPAHRRHLVRLRLPGLPKIRTCRMKASGSSSRGFAYRAVHGVENSRWRKRKALEQLRELIPSTARRSAFSGAG